MWETLILMSFTAEKNHKYLFISTWILRESVVVIGVQIRLYPIIYEKYVFRTREIAYVAHIPELPLFCWFHSSRVLFFLPVLVSYQVQHLMRANQNEIASKPCSFHLPDICAAIFRKHSRNGDSSRFLGLLSPRQCWQGHYDFVFSNINFWVLGSSFSDVWNVRGWPWPSGDCMTHIS